MEALVYLELIDGSMVGREKEVVKHLSRED